MTRPRAPAISRGWPGGTIDRVLQAEWSQYGPGAFTFEVLDTLEPPDRADDDPLEDLAALEDIWLEKLSIAADPLHTINRARLK